MVIMPHNLFLFQRLWVSERFPPTTLLHFAIHYKIVVKILTKRLQPILPNIISENQSAFIPRWAISGNVLITHEILHYLWLSKASKRGDMAVKMDMSKVYDCIEWGFLEVVLRRLGFASIWIEWILECVTTFSYYFLVNGSPQGQVTLMRGLRQMDPLSSYFFILCMEVLSGLCRKCQGDGTLPDVRVAWNSPRVNHLLFADDTMFFCNMEVKSCKALTDIWKKYEIEVGNVSTLKNPQSSIHQRHHHRLKRELSEAYASQKGGTGKYLGLPKNFGRKKNDIFA